LPTAIMKMLGRRELECTANRGPQRAGSDDKSYTVAASLDDLSKSKEAAIRFQPVPRKPRAHPAGTGIPRPAKSAKSSRWQRRVPRKRRHE
jgi:hypothetical protein